LNNPAVNTPGVGKQKRGKGPRTRKQLLAIRKARWAALHPPKPKERTWKKEKP
jgi:hypothetical protein